MKCVCVCARRTTDVAVAAALSPVALCAFAGNTKKEGASMRSLASESVRSLCDDDGDVQKPSVVIKHG